MSPSSERSLHYRFLVFLILAGCCFRIFVCFQHNPLHYLASDMLRHWNDGVAFPMSGIADPILYQAYIFVLSAIAGGNAFLVGLAAALLSVLMPWTYYRAARDFGLQKLPALWVWALIAWTPSLLVIYHYVMMETLLLPLEGIGLWMTARYLRKGGNEPFLAMIFFWTLASLTKPTIGPLAAVCVLWCCWKKLPSLRAASISVVVIALLLAPSAIRSKRAMGFVAPFGNSWFIKIQHRSGMREIQLRFRSHYGRVETSSSISPSCYVRPLSPLSQWQLRRASQNTQISVSVDAAHGDQDWKDAYNALNVGADEWLAQWRENIVLFLFAPSWPESMVPEWDGRLELEARWMWAPLVLIVLVGNLREFASRRFDLIPVAVTLFTLFLALQNVVTFEGRYRKPLEPLLLLNLVWVVSQDRSRPRADVPGLPS